ncbi:MAG: helicase-exonuclease AddAB subunit AddA [Eubacterium sp.]|nr:helicase-exonuclease AddAB subunit AddA [Eubacterium sp.]
MPRWTEQQNNAINARNSNILVSAAAGSGKTAVLVERVLKIITDKNNPVNVDRLLCVTFTNAAAAEMKSRIAARLEDIIRDDPSDINAQRQMSLLPSAKICTVDSFCLNLVKDNFFNLGLSQDFTVLDEAELNVLEESAINTVLDSFYEEKDAEFLRLTELLSSPKDDKALISNIKKIRNYIYAQPFPHKWLRDMAEYYDPSVSFEESVWYPKLIDEIKYALEFGKSLIAECFDMLDVGDELFEKYSNNLSDDLRIYDYLLSNISNGWDALVTAFGNVKFPTLASKRGYISPVKADLAARRDIYKSIVNKDLKPFFCALTEDHANDMQELYPVLIKLCELIEAVDRELSALKEERNGYSFSDIEHFAINLLAEQNENGEPVKSALALDMTNNFYEILVDEYQDTNEAQDLIYNLLSNGNNCFTVGDVKQSIYRFRLAMPHIFIKKRDEYKDYVEGEEESARIVFDRNFRSRRNICDYVNFVFSAFMSKRAGEIDYNESEFLNYGADYEDKDITSAQIKILKNTKRADLDRNEAIYIANTILNKVNSKELVKDKDGYRPIRFGDFAILLRSAKRHIKEYNEVLTSFGIPVICENSSNLFDCNEIKILLSLLRVIDNPMQDIPLLSVMMSPLYGFTADELAQIKTENSIKGSLYVSVINSKSEKVRRFLDEIDMFSKVAVTMSVSYFVRYICEYKSVYAFVNALGNGEQRCRNIGKLIDLAAAFDSSDSVGLTSFIRYIDKVAQSDRGVESASLNPGAENAVTIMSIHHSKGLEFPVVILAGAQGEYNKSDLNEKLLLNPFLGLGVKVHNEERLYDYETIPYAVVRTQNKSALLSENLRTLYVAMTRAKEQFISFVTVDNLESKVNSLASKISDGGVSPYLCLKIRSDGDYLLLAALLHQDGGGLRSYTDIGIKTIAADFPLDVEIIDSVDEIAENQPDEKSLPNEGIISQIADKLAYQYENAALSRAAAKRTASGLDESIKSFDYFASAKPAFMNDGEMTPAEKGTAMHAFMQFCDYAGAKRNLEAEIARLADNAFITNAQADCLNREELKMLFDSDFSKRLFKSDKIYRELKISSFVKLREIEDIDSDEEVLIQGISDCVFEENGELVLVDYKTDRVKSENQLLSMYENQIAFYKKAVAKTLGKRVKEALLYSFCLGKVCRYK